MMWHGGLWRLGLGFGLIVMLAITALVFVLAIVFAIRFLRNSHNLSKPVAGGTALDTLDERYAKGELLDEEYRVKKAELKK